MHKPLNHGQNTASQSQAIIDSGKPQVARSIMSARNSLRESYNKLLSPRMTPTVTNITKKHLSQSPKPSPLRGSHSVMSH